MKRTDAIMRAIAFYVSVAVFFILLPIVISYSLGFKIDYSEFKIYKTGIIYLRSDPAGARVYINGKLHKDITPTQIDELKPGHYKLSVVRDGFYTWEGEVRVHPNMATKVDSIVLFPVIEKMERISARNVNDFIISGRGLIYFMTPTGLCRSAMDGTGERYISSFSEWPDEIRGKLFSPDEEKFLIFNKRSIWVADVNIDRRLTLDGGTAIVFRVVESDVPIREAFWHSSSGYIIYLSGHDLNAVEVSGKGGRNVVTLYKFNSHPGTVRYDSVSDSIYFTDTEPMSHDGKRYLYRLDLRQKFFAQILRRLQKEFNIEYEKR